ncbi:MAG TPA: bi-domain-containing oxidoreductase [Terriglobales bacterium]|nr:bi-domain-containing oxidoreductase [Terriglobales bacterium]
MKQVLQQPSTGEISVADVPAPQLLPGCVLVSIRASLVSAGTERASSEFARKSLLQKAQARPDLVREVINKVRRDGLLSAVHAVRSRLDQPTSLGYSSAGIVTGVGEGVTDIAVGDRVACAGAGYAVHAEVVCVPRLLVAKTPDGACSFEEAAFTTLGAVALHGIRTAEVKLGDAVAVIGLGLVGQLTVQLLKAAGCRVLGFDIAPDRAELAVRLGADSASSASSEFADICAQKTHGFGVDAVLITAETSSSEPVNQAAEIARDRAVVVAVGTVGMELQRQRYYEKELDFRVSRSYGPGRYDAAYEQKGRDYPIGHVRWTETRNMEGFLQLLTEGKLNLNPLITHRFPIDQAREAYDLISGARRERSLGVIFTYSGSADLSQRINLVPPESQNAARHQEDLRIGLLGAGTFAVGTLLPALQQAANAEMVVVCTATGAHSRHAAEKFKFRISSTDERDVLNSQDVNTVVIATRHHLHANQVLGALAAQKNVFCEKPLCLNEGELAKIVRAHGASSHEQNPRLMVGFNRRFAPMILRMKEFLTLKEPLALHYRVNAGALPPDHWINDPEIGGGRIVGEVCHFVDLLSFLASALPIEVYARTLANNGLYSDDNVLISLRFENGSEGTIHYLANGDRAFSKDRIEVFGGGAAAVLDDFRKLEMTRFGKRSTLSARWRQNKGHRGEWQAFAKCLREGGPEPIPFESIVSSTLTTFCIQKSRASGQPVIVDVRGFMQAALRNDS